MRSLKTTLALGVLGLGVAGAWMFRRDEEAKPAAPVQQRLVLREPASFQPFNDEGLEQFRNAPPPEPPPQPAPPPIPKSPLDRSVAPPVIADSYAAATVPNVRDLDVVLQESLGPAGAAQPGTVIHRVSDGDTLASLADKYLKAPGRAAEIYEANRDVLPGPDILPIGAKLKIVVHSPLSRGEENKQVRSGHMEEVQWSEAQ